MISKNFHAGIFPSMSLAIGIGTFFILRFGDQSIPFMRLLMGPPEGNSFPAWGIPALLAGLFGFLRPRPKEIWSYGVLMWAPRIIIFGTAWTVGTRSGLSGFDFLIAASALLAAIVAVVASYAGFALHKIVAKHMFVTGQTPTIFGK
jgi:hypothetical protein